MHGPQAGAGTMLRVGKGVDSGGMGGGGRGERTREGIKLKSNQNRIISRVCGISVQRDRGKVQIKSHLKMLFLDHQFAAAMFCTLRPISTDSSASQP